MNRYFALQGFPYVFLRLCSPVVCPQVQASCPMPTPSYALLPMLSCGLPPGTSLVPHAYSFLCPTNAQPMSVLIIQITTIPSTISVVCPQAHSSCPMPTPSYAQPFILGLLRFHHESSIVLCSIIPAILPRPNGNYITNILNTSFGAQFKGRPPRPNNQLF